MWTLAGCELESRILLGTARYPSPKALQDSITASRTGVITVSLRRESAGSGNGARFWDLLKACKVRILPNTAGCHSVAEAVTTAHMARELFDTNWIKLEVIGDDYSLQPDPFGLVEAARILIRDGFEVFPYMTEDLIVAERLVAAGCRVLMPWGSPIGTGRGLVNPAALTALRARFPDVALILDAGIGRPSHATQALELGFDAVLLNTAVATADDPPRMAAAFAAAVEAGRLAYEAGLMLPRERAVPSTPVVGRAFRPTEGQAP
jgi:thiazole synthase